MDLTLFSSLFSNKSITSNLTIYKTSLSIKIIKVLEDNSIR